MTEPLDLDALEAAANAALPTPVTLDAITWRGHAKLLIAEVRRLRAEIERRAKAEPEPRLEKR